MRRQIGRASCRERVEMSGAAGSSRRRHTRFDCDWSSDVCSSDLDRSFIELLAGAARRGVDVRVLVGGPLTDVPVTRLAAHARYDSLLSAGVRVYEYQPTTLHAKTFVVDGVWTSVGTMNFDNRSLALNDESTLMILDSAAGRRMEEVFMDDLRQSKEVDLVTFRRRSWTRRVAEWAANQMTRLL